MTDRKGLADQAAAFVSGVAGETAGSATEPPVEAEEAVKQSWFGMTLLRATALLGLIAAYLAALGAIFKWFRDDFSAFQKQEPLIFWVLLVLPLLFIAAFSVGPELWSRWQRARRRRRALTADTGVPAAGYFRLDPYDPGAPGAFVRADGAHERVRRWIEQTQRPLLFLSGASGTGKSSLLQAYVLPALEQQGWHIEALRSFAEPAADLERALKAARRSGKPALVVVDQFEEFVILEGRAASEGGRAFIARLKELRQKPIPSWPSCSPCAATISTRSSSWTSTTWIPARTGGRSTRSSGQRRGCSSAAPRPGRRPISSSGCWTVSTRSRRCRGSTGR